MFLLLLAVSLCTLATLMLLFKVKAKWFAVVGFLNFAFMLLGGERINLTFAHENQTFLFVTFNFFNVLYLYFAKPKKNLEFLGQPVKPFLNSPFYISTCAILGGFGLPLLFYLPDWRVLEPGDWASALLSFYMGAVGIFLFKRAWRVRTLRLELQQSLEEH